MKPKQLFYVRMWEENTRKFQGDDYRIDTVDTNSLSDRGIGRASEGEGTDSLLEKQIKPSRPRHLFRQHF